MKRRILAAIGLLIFMYYDAVAQNTATDHPRAIICLTYDDALESQLENAIPQLDSFGLKATFFITSIQGATEVAGKAPRPITGWIRAAKKGHELGNHTLFHPCSAKLQSDSTVSAEGYTLNKILDEIRVANLVLSVIDPERELRTFAYPCNSAIIENMDYSGLLQTKGLASFARTGGDKNSIVADPAKVDPVQVPSWLVEEGTTLTDLVAFAGKVKKAGGLGVYQFHSIGSGPFFRISKETHQAFLAYLTSHSADYWVTTFSGAMEYITGRSAAN